MGRRHELTEAEWARLAPLLPRRQAGKPRKDDRLVINGILWKLATGRLAASCPSGPGPGRAWTPATGAGGGPGSGTACSRRCSRRRTPPARSTGRSTSWMAR
jgi:transposase